MKRPRPVNKDSDYWLKKESRKMGYNIDYLDYLTKEDIKDDFSCKFCGVEHDKSKESVKK